MDKTLDEALQSVTDAETVGDSLVALTNKLHSDLKEALAGEKLSPAAQSKVNAIFAGVQAQKEKYATAVLTNTDSEPEPT